MLNLRLRDSRYSLDYSRMYSRSSVFSLSLFLVFHIETDGGFFSTWLPVTPLKVSWLELKTVRLSERPRGRKGGPKCRLFFILMQPHAPRRGTFSANRSENFAITDVCNWQIILMVILDEKRAIVNRKGSISLQYMTLSYRYIISQTYWEINILLINSDYSKLERYKNYKKEPT